MNTGRWRRARIVRSIVPLPMIGSELAVQEMMMSYSGKRSGRSRSSIDSALKRRAGHHGVEARCDAERVPNRFALREGIEVGPQFLGLDAMIACEPLESGLRLAQRAVNLGAIAGRKDCSLPDRLAESQLRERRSKALGVKR